MLRRWQAFLVEQLTALCQGGPVWSVEIGVGSGSTSAICLRQFPDLHLYMIDPWFADPTYMVESANILCTPAGQPLVQDDFDAMAACAEKVTRFAADRRTILRMPSRQAAKEIPDGQLSLVFIDGDHSAAAVASDCQFYWPKLRVGGIFSGHDYGNRHHPGVKKAVDAWAAEWGVKLSFCSRSVWYLRKEAAP